MKSKSIQLLGAFLMLYCLMSCNVYQNKDTTVAEKWVQLFNGEDLEDWILRLKDTL